MTTWRDVVDLQGGCVRWARTDEAYRHFLEQLLPGEDELREQVAEYSRASFIRACGGSGYFFTPEMTQLLMGASESLGSWTLKRMDFEYPVAPSGVAFCAVPERKSDGPDTVGFAWETSPETDVAQCWPLQQARGGGFAPTVLEAYVFDRERSFDPGTLDSVLPAFLAFVRQKVAVVGQERLPRSFTRRASRQGLIPTVSVVTLRRPYTRPGNDEEGSGDVEWSHRWLVDGHWRAQWYPSELRHRPIWISPYVKGPEDRPLVVKRKVFKVER